MQIVNTKMFQTIKHAKVNNNFIKSSQKLTGRLCSARRTNLICLQWGEQCREQTMLEMDFSGNNKTGNTIALMDKIMQKIHMKIYTSIFWLQLSLKLNYILTNNSFQSDLSTLIFFSRVAEAAWSARKNILLTHDLLDIISNSCVPIPFKSSYSNEIFFSSVITN